MSLFAIALASLLSVAQADQAAFQTCVACHGANAEGNVAMNAPALGGLDAWYMEAQLKNFKAGVRGGANDALGMTMKPMADMLTDAQVTSVSAYIAGLATTKSAPSLGGNAARGETLYATCAACHGANAEGNEAMKAPALAGQQDWYIVNQLKAFKGGVRGANAATDAAGATMAPMAATLPDEQAMKDVAAFIAGK